jgi:nicotinamide-nucleotide amidase
MWFEKDGKIFISMPGVPHEMKGMMKDYVLPRLPSIFKLPKVEHRTLLTAGIGESFLAERIQKFEEALPSTIKLAYLPNYGMVRLRLTATGEDDNVYQEIDERFKALQALLEDVMVINEDVSLEEAIGKLLKQKGKTLSTAESCTGGYIAHLITSIAGSSTYFIGSVVSYANSVKEGMLQVKSDTLVNNGAVSEQTVVEMAQGVRSKMNTDYSLAVSGIMGPGGGTETKPVGTVWIAVAGEERTMTKKLELRFDRKRNIEITATQALNMLRLLMINREAL